MPSTVKTPPMRYEMDTRAIRSRMTKMLVIGALLLSSVGLLSDTVQTKLQTQAVNPFVTKMESEQRGRSGPEWQSTEAKLEAETTPPAPVSSPAALPVSTQPAESSVILPGQNSPGLTTTESKSQLSSFAAPTPAVSSVEIANAEPVAAPRSILEPAKLDVPADQIQSAPVVAPQQAAASPVTSVSKPLPQTDTTTQKNQKMDRAKAKKLPKRPTLPRIGTHAEDFIPELDTQRLPKRYRRILEKYGLD
jgi:hypothetical protein